MGWKDYFYFTKTERNGITVLVMLILLVLIFPSVYQKLHHEEVYEFDEFREKVEQYEKLLAAYHEAQRVMDEERKILAEKRKKEEKQITLTPFAFNPNESGLEEFIELGLSERMAKTIINYRNAGGSFRVKEDFKRIYSITETIYAQLEPYIDLPSREERSRLAEQKKKDWTKSENKGEGKQNPTKLANIVLDINKADTTEWQKIRGIGPVFSKRIASYRDLLGGFYSIEQLKEVYGMDSVRFEQIQPHLSIDSIELRLININSADFATLVRHPYLNRNQVNSIIKMRERHGVYRSVEDIRQSELINEQDFTRIKPYLSVEENKQQPDQNVEKIK